VLDITEQWCIQRTKVQSGNTCIPPVERLLSTGLWNQVQQSGRCR